MVQPIGNWPPPPPRTGEYAQTYQQRLRDWLENETAYIQREDDNSLSYYVGNSYFNIKTLSGTHADEEETLSWKIRARRKAKSDNQVTVAVNIDTTQAVEVLQRLRQQVEELTTCIATLGASFIEWGMHLNKAFRIRP